ncbi:11654_t:CDS:2, partial [Ambispora leptoticha]
ISKAKSKNRHIGAGLNPLYPDVEEELNKWIEMLCQDGIAITTYMHLINGSIAL